MTDQMVSKYLRAIYWIFFLFILVKSPSAFSLEKQTNSHYVSGISTVHYVLPNQANYTLKQCLDVFKKASLELKLYRFDRAEYILNLILKRCSRESVKNNAMAKLNELNRIYNEMKVSFQTSGKTDVYHEFLLRLDRHNGLKSALNIKALDATPFTNMSKTFFDLSVIYAEYIEVNGVPFSFIEQDFKAAWVPIVQYLRARFETEIADEKYFATQREFQLAKNTFNPAPVNIATILSNTSRKYLKVKKQNGRGYTYKTQELISTVELQQLQKDMEAVTLAWYKKVSPDNRIVTLPEEQVIDKIYENAWSKTLVWQVLQENYRSDDFKNIPKNVRKAQDCANIYQDEYWYALPDNHSGKVRINRLANELNKLTSKEQKRKWLMGNSEFGYYDVETYTHSLPPPIRAAFNYKEPTNDNSVSTHTYALKCSKITPCDKYRFTVTIPAALTQGAKITRSDFTEFFAKFFEGDDGFYHWPVGAAMGSSGGTSLAKAAIGILNASNSSTINGKVYKDTLVLAGNLITPIGILTAAESGTHVIMPLLKTPIYVVGTWEREKGMQGCRMPN